MKKVTMGFEIHRQIGNKLFCKCITSSNKNVLDKKLFAELPYMLQTYTETKQHTYYYNDVCDYELDEQPPLLNKEIIPVVGRLLKIFNFKPVEKIIFMRKHILDGSLLNGFQRTAIVGTDGFVVYNDLLIHLPFIYLEEDSCSIYQDGWNLQRQGTALVEIVSDPIEVSPHDFKEILLLIGAMLRKTTSVEGIGTIRQDINIDAGFGKVELKGVQDIDNVPTVITNEINRQLREKTGLHTRKIVGVHSEFSRGHQKADRMDIETEIPVFTIPYSDLLSVDLSNITHKELKKTVDAYKYLLLLSKLKQPTTNAIAQLIVQNCNVLIIDLLNQGKTCQQIKYACKNNLLAQLANTTNLTEKEITDVQDPINYYKQNALRLPSYQWLVNVLKKRNI